MPDEKAPEELPDVELPPAEPVSEVPAEAPVEVGPPPAAEAGESPVIEPPAGEPAVEAPVAPPPPLAPVAPVAPPPDALASNSKLWALLAYVLSPVAPIVILLVEDMKNQPYLKPHTMQALVAGGAIIIITLILGVIPLIGCLSPLVAIVGWIAMIYWGLQAYNGKPVTIPVVTNLVQKQGWA
jgi:uncharacterized membrane protein